MMLHYRRAVESDIFALGELARDGLIEKGKVDQLPLHIDMHKVRGIINNFVVMPGHFQMAAFDETGPVAALAMAVVEMPFFERCEGHIMMCYSVVPGAGWKLLREMFKFVEADIRIRRVIWSMNDGADRLARLAQRRLGFSRGDQLVYYKGV